MFLFAMFLFDHTFTAPMFGVLVLISVQHVDMPHNAVQYCMLRSTAVSTVLLCKQQCSYFLSSIFFCHSLVSAPRVALAATVNPSLSKSTSLYRFG